jgi:hypothetical protein
VKNFSAVLFWFLFPVISHAEIVIDFHAFVQSSYTHLEKLPGVLTTVSVLEHSLEKIPGSRLQVTVLQDKTPEDLRALLRSLPGEKEASLSVIYLAGHQSAAGELEFTGKQKLPWSQLLHALDIPAHCHRVTILDTCYAEAADLRSDMRKKLGPLLIFSSGAGEKTYELDLKTRRPVDYGRRYLRELEWLNKDLNLDSPEHITFFGFMWCKAFLREPWIHAQEMNWERFFRQMCVEGDFFRRERSEKLASTMVIRGS